MPPLCLLTLCKDVAANRGFMEDVLGAQLREQMRASARAENEGLAAMIGGAANREALSAFREKREPDFTGI